MSKHIANLKRDVEKIMTEFERARNDDQWLTIKLWTLRFPSKIQIEEKEDGEGKKQIRKWVYLDDILKFPREDSIRRVRAIIQNDEGKLLPTDWKVAKQRKINEDIWKDYVRNQSEYKRL